MNPTESMLVLGIAALATAIAVGSVSVPVTLLDSSVAQAFMLVIALILFSYSPVVGIAALALFAILMFHRNVKKTVQYSSVLSSMQQYITPAETKEVNGYDTQYPDHRDVQKFEDVYEAYQSEPAEAPVEAVQPQEDGMYPERSTETTEDVRTESYMYQPDEKMGDNTFEPVGISIDDKYASFRY